MKKVFLAITVISTVFLASCAKDRTCTCTQTNSTTNGGVTTSTSSSDVKVLHVTKREANKAYSCPKSDTQTSTQGTGAGAVTQIQTITCTLK